MCITANEFENKLYKLSLYYFGRETPVKVSIFANSNRGAMRKAMHLFKHFYNSEHRETEIKSLFLASQNGAWKAQRFFEEGSPYTPWVVLKGEVK